MNDGSYLLKFPAFRSNEWLEKNRLMPAPNACLFNVKLEPQSLLQYAHVKAYKTKADVVRNEMRNSLFRQALFKIQNVEVVATKKCREDRILLDIANEWRPWKLPKFITNATKRPLISEELWTIDRCGESQRYKVRYYKEGVDGFYCKVYVTSFYNIINYIRYYLSF